MCKWAEAVYIDCIININTNKYIVKPQLGKIVLDTGNEAYFEFFDVTLIIMLWEGIIIVFLYLKTIAQRSII